ncbi:hypothetical protein AB0M20_21525 [Actinoplanes sp. NPDC051633]|uniref:hypothetical protein n=1 Tax=Actinoplanes sp. NPDC051633 TaxID=3155670 RepID=UPI00344796D0
MTRRLKVVIAVATTLAGLAGVIVMLTGESLDRAEKWVSLVGVFVSVAVSVAGLVIGWLAFRQGRGTAAAVVARKTGNATAVGDGSVANTGSLGPAASFVSDTGDAKAEHGGRANTGHDATDKP